MNTFIVEAENYKTLQTENVNISEYGITPDSVYSIKFTRSTKGTVPNGFLANINSSAYIQ